MKHDSQVSLELNYCNVFTFSHSLVYNVTDSIFVAPATDAGILKIFINKKKQCRVGWFNTIPGQTNIFERN